MNLHHPGRFQVIGSPRPGWLLVRFVCPHCYLTFYLDCPNDPQAHKEDTRELHCPACQSCHPYARGPND